MNSLLLVFILPLILVSARKDALKQFSKGNRRFSAKIYKELATTHDGNFLVCPLSAEIALALTQAGADEETAIEIRKALRFPKSTAEVESAFENLLPSIRRVEQVTLKYANRIYVQNSYPVKEQFNETAVRVFGASTQNVDFTKSGEAVNIINEWVMQQTNNKITNLIVSDSLGEDTVAVLVNALYLHATWVRPFKTELTESKTFFKSTTDQIQVDFMKKQGMNRYSESEELEAKFLELPFKGKELRIIFVLPNEVDGLQAVEENISKIFNFGNFTTENVQIELPKFKIETSIDLKRILKNLGVNKAFTRPDFSGIAGDAGEIYISNVLQKTFIGVNEHGVEAAASSAVLFHPKSLLDSYGDVKTFKADHPFLFYIKFQEVVIFAGRVSAPST